ncbi:Uncharacterized protein GBIM_16028 [Gryllus bimaculatus]|nr:Uncharacterized protein GBIM_16028 [Gryllus bimaculatus]
MVHKKSEYRLQFHSLTQDLRKQIWQENIRFREFQRSVNQAHHYWSYQITDEPCVCDDGTEECKNRIQDFTAPVILDSLEKSSDIQGNVQESCLSKKKSGTQRQVRLMDPETDEILAHEVAVQTPDWTPEEKASSPEDPPELHHLMKNLRTSSPEYKDTKKESAGPQRPNVMISTKSPESVSTMMQSAMGSSSEDRLKFTERPASCCSPEYNRRDFPSRFSSLSKTSRKYFFEEKKMPFVSYGWNDADKNIGEKKTYNVSAPESQVHSPALRAQKRRREDIEKYLRRELDLSKRISQTKSPVNLSSIWMSEYQEKFSQGAKSFGKICRPMSAPLYYPLGWRCR